MARDPARLLDEGETLHWWAAGDDGSDTLRFAPFLPEPRAPLLSAAFGLPIAGLKLFEFAAIPDGGAAYRALDAAYAARTGHPPILQVTSTLFLSPKEGEQEDRL